MNFQRTAFAAAVAALALSTGAHGQTATSLDCTGCVTSTHILNGTVAGADVADGGLTGADVADSGLSGADIKDEVGGRAAIGSFVSIATLAPCFGTSAGWTDLGGVNLTPPSGNGWIVIDVNGSATINTAGTDLVYKISTAAGDLSNWGTRTLTADRNNDTEQFYSRATVGANIGSQRYILKACRNNNVNTTGTFRWDAITATYYVTQY